MCPVCTGEELERGLVIAKVMWDRWVDTRTLADEINATYVSVIIFGRVRMTWLCCNTNAAFSLSRRTVWSALLHTPVRDPIRNRWITVQQVAWFSAGTVQPQNRHYTGTLHYFK